MSTLKLLLPLAAFALLALLLAREGLPVLVHGCTTEATRITSENVLAALGIPSLSAIESIVPGSVAFAPTALLQPGLARLLEVRRVLGVRNSAHSLVKLMNPLAPVGGRAIIVGSYTHPEYAQSMAATFALIQGDAMLLRGTEGEPVADARRMPQMDGYIDGQHVRLQDAQTGILPAGASAAANASAPVEPTPPPEALPVGANAEQTATLIRAMLDGALPVPTSISTQVERLLHLAVQLETT